LIPVGFGNGDRDEFFYRDGYGIAKPVPAPLDIKIASYLNVKVPFTKLKRRR